MTTLVAQTFEFSLPVSLSPVEDAIVQLKAVQPSLLLSFPGDDPFRADAQFWSKNRRDQAEQALCAVHPRDASEIAIVGKILSAAACPFIVTSTGHHWASVSARAHVLISLAQLNEISYDAEKQTVDIGPGNTWGAVYDALAPAGVTVVGARHPGVGVGGSTLHGGYSYHSNQYGMISDNVLAYDMVTMTGDIVHVTKASNAELFSALQIAGSQLGVVTKIKFRTIPQGLVYAGRLTFPLAALPMLSQDLSTLPSKSSVMMDLTVSGVTAYCFHDGPDAVFEHLLVIPGRQGELKTQTFSEFVWDSVSHEEAQTDRIMMHTVSLTAYPARVISKIVEVMQAFSSPSIQILASLSSNSPFHVRITYADAKDDLMCSRLVQKICAQVEMKAKELGVLGQGLYANYAHPDTSPNAVYGEKATSIERMRKVMDPNRMMDLVVGGVKF